MIKYIFKKKRNGKNSRTYYGRYQLDWMPKVKEINLKVTDKQAAETTLNKIVKEAQQEKAGIIQPKAIREAAKRNIESHLEDYLTVLSNRNRKPNHIKNVRSYVMTVANECNWTLLEDMSGGQFEEWRSL